MPGWRAKLEDPGARDRILADTTAFYRRMSPGLAKYVGLNGDEFSRMMNTLTDMDLKITDQRYQCALQPDCDDRPILQGIEPERQRLLADLLGPEKKQRLDTYEHNMPERAVVTNLRGTLRDPDNLSDSQADQLIDALGDELSSVRQGWEFQARGRRQSQFTSHWVRAIKAP